MSRRTSHLFPVTSNIKESLVTNEQMSTQLNYTQAQFLSSAPSLRDCPADNGAEVAFAGRSNAGKSSAINVLTQNKKLARTSKTPGRTQLLNFFSVNDRCRLVDLPGYGFAKAPIVVKNTWQRHLENYLRRRQSLRGLILLMDSRHPLQAFDQQLLSWTEQSAMPVHVLLTKADKLSKGAAKATLLKVQKALNSDRQSVSVQLFSSLKRQGRELLVAKLDGWFGD